MKKVKNLLSWREWVREAIILTVAAIIIASAVFFFLVPSHAAVSSISGASMFPILPYLP